MELTRSLKQRATELGFALSGVAAAATPGRLQAFHAWLEAGYAGEMSYLHTRREAYSHPRYVLEGCRSILMLALPYGPSPAIKLGVVDRNTGPNAAGSLASGNSLSTAPEHAKVARYAQGSRDYHDVITDKLKQLRGWLQEQYPQSSVRGVVDTAPLLERELAAAAGLGWIGKNTLLLNRQWGSYFFLAALLTDLELVPDESDEHSYCGTCTACLDACPTNAFPQPFVLDARRCISYLTIEHRGDIEATLQQQLSGWVFGCDICQQVCPWNRRVPESSLEEFAPREDLQELDLVELLGLDEAAFRQRFRHTPLWRAKRRGLLRNAILVAGTKKLPQAHAPLLRLCNDDEELLAQAARWAVSQYEGLRLEA